MTKIPDVLWYQDKEYVYVSFPVLSAKDVALNIQEGCVDFSCSGENSEKYQVKLELFEKIDKENSSSKTLGRKVDLKMKKANTEKWLRLLKEGKPYYVKADWSHDMYDSDEEKEEFDLGGYGSGMDFMQNGGGMGTEGFDSDDGENEEEECESGEHAKCDDDCCGHDCHSKDGEKDQPACRDCVDKDVAKQES